MRENGDRFRCMVNILPSRGEASANMQEMGHTPQGGAGHVCRPEGSGKTRGKHVSASTQSPSFSQLTP